MEIVKLSSKGQIVIPKYIRDKLGLRKGSRLRIRLENKRIILEPVTEPPEEIFVKAGPEITEPILKEAKESSSKWG